MAAFSLGLELAREVIHYFLVNESSDLTFFSLFELSNSVLSVK